MPFPSLQKIYIRTTHLIPINLTTFNLPIYPTYVLNIHHQYLKLFLSNRIMQVANSNNRLLLVYWWWSIFVISLFHTKIYPWIILPPSILVIRIVIIISRTISIWLSFIVIFMLLSIFTNFLIQGDYHFLFCLLKYLLITLINTLNLASFKKIQFT